MSFWNTVGSAGIVDEGSIGKVIMDTAIVRMRGLGDPAPPVPPGPGEALLRYNVVFVPGAGGPNVMIVRYRDVGQATRVVVTLFQANVTNDVITQHALMDTLTQPQGPGFNTVNVPITMPLDLNPRSLHFVQVALSITAPLPAPLPVTQTPAVLGLTITTAN